MVSPPFPETSTLMLPWEAQETKKVEENLRTAMEAPKCHPCGCFHLAVAALEQSPVGSGPLADSLQAARERLRDQEYDCLGCDPCWPADAYQAAARLDPDLGRRG